MAATGKLVAAQGIADQFASNARHERLRRSLVRQTRARM